MDDVLSLNDAYRARDRIVNEYASAIAYGKITPASRKKFNQRMLEAEQILHVLEEKSRCT